MPETHFDVLAIGNAIVDILAYAEDNLLDRLELIKGTMALIDSDALEILYNQIEPVAECSGGSVANTIAGVVSLGGQGAFVGKVCDDHFGQIFTRDMKAAGVTFKTPLAKSGPPTAASIVLVTPDAERTMQTHLGISVELDPSDINASEIVKAQVTFLEGYLWDPPTARLALLKAADLAFGAGRKVSLSLSDSFCVDRHRQEFIDLINSRIDILFGNEEEIISLYQTKTFEEAVKTIRGRCEVVVLTRGALGCVVLTSENVQEVPARRVDKIVDTTGAGDAFAAGFLSGFTRGYGVITAARLGNILASEVISHIGARPATCLKDLADEYLDIN